MGVDRTTGPRQGWIYIATAEKNLSPAGTDPDIILHKSTNGGTTWSAGVRVNQDALNNGKTQYMPALRVDEYGGVNVIYYDDRNTSTDSSEVYVSRSIDGGVTWTDILVSDHRFKPKSITGLAGGYQGDYIGITSGNNKIYPYWCDDISGIYQAWITTIDLGPSIIHTPLANTEQTTGTRQVLAQIIPAGSEINPSLTKLYFTKNPSTFTDNVLMSNIGGTNWTANITLSGEGTYRYYIETVDLLNRTATAPGGAPANYYSFTAIPDVVNPVITHSALPNIPKLQWPATVTASATDNIGIDSVWVKWYKNFTSNGIRQFKLLHQGGDSYSAAFNSVQSDVLAGDVIYYRIFARDNSSAHNTDSTSLYSFSIINQTTVCIGAGIAEIGWPFYTYYMDSRTDMLYLSSEMGLSESGYIQKIGFTVTSAASQVMNGFTVKMQNTTASSISAFTNSGWTVAYNGTYTVPGTGLQYIELQTPFYYEQGKNLLIEICFNNSSWTSNTTVYGTAVTNRNKHQHSDLTSGDGCSEITTPGSTYTTLPNICFVINPVQQNLSLNLKAYLEGFWNSSTQVSDTAKVYLANSTSPYALIDSQKVVISAAGTANLTFTNASEGSYYIVIKHRNHLETWSALPQTFSLNSESSYDFTTTQSQAFGNNLIYSNGAWCIYGGDINHDGFVDGADMAILDNDLYNYISGYVAADVNGDQFVDGADMAILDNNLYNYIGVVKPGSKDAIRKNIFKPTWKNKKTIWDVKETKKQREKVIRKQEEKVIRKQGDKDLKQRQ
jgi:hypothetical protein